MKRILTISLLSLWVFLAFATHAHAEVIKSFDSTVVVSPDASITVTEKIIYDYEGASRHGIFRTIPLSGKDASLQVDAISVVDSTNTPYQFSTNTSNGELAVRIGDPNKTISGVHEYDITYHVMGAVGYYDSYDEIYWNVTGTGWPVSIQKAYAKVILPASVSSTQEACYIGVQGSTTPCTIVAPGSFSAPRILSAGEGLTVAVGFPKGVVAVYTQHVDSPFVAFLKTFWPIVIPVLVFIFMFLFWRKKGRDPKGTGVIVAQYDVPEGLTPIEVGGIVKGKIKNEYISAEVIYLATQGYITIGYVESKTLGVFTSKDYELTLLKDGTGLSDFDRKILVGIFGEEMVVGTTVALSSLKNKFYKFLPDVVSSALSSLSEKGYYSYILSSFSKVLYISLLIFGGSAILIASIYFGNPDVPNTTYIIVYVISLIVTVIIVAVFNSILSARSVKGVATYEYLLGLKEYLRIAEKDRLEFHNAPEKKPEIFEKLLPYAMIFGVEQLWAKEFQDVYVNPPSWYRGPAGTFNAVSFGNQMALFNASSATAFTSSPGGGSGGGGFSGGGGGGGGGGSW